MQTNESSATKQDVQNILKAIAATQQDVSGIRQTVESTQQNVHVLQHDVQTLQDNVKDLQQNMQNVQQDIKDILEASTALATHMENRSQSNIILQVDRYYVRKPGVSMA